MDLIMKRLFSFLLGAILPASIAVVIYTFVLGHCDPKFGCDGTLGFYLALSIVPVALIGAMTFWGAMKLAGVRFSYTGVELIMSGALVSLSNIVTIQIAEDYGFILVISGIVVLSLFVFGLVSSIHRVIHSPTSR